MAFIGRLLGDEDNPYRKKIARQRNIRRGLAVGVVGLTAAFLYFNQKSEENPQGLDEEMLESLKNAPTITID